MKTGFLIFLFFVSAVSGQQNIAFDSLRLRDANDLLADDYGNIYLYKNSDFSFTKYDSLGTQKGKLLFTVPHKIQSVQNPLSIPAFSENAQEIRLYDHNLNEIQTINFRQKFWFIKMAYVEDLQQMWLLDESAKRLLQYNYRNDTIINSFSLDISFEQILDMLVFDNKLYALMKNRVVLYDFKSQKIAEIAVSDGRKLRRENDNIFIIGKNSIEKLETQKLSTVFSAENSQIVDKNSLSYYVTKANKLYLYPIKKND